MEFEALKAIVDTIASDYSVVEEPMNPHLTVTAENIFWDASGVREHTNPLLKEMYIRFRTHYFASIRTKHPITQALYEKYLNVGDAHEMEFLEKYYQNWGTPEDNRIRPHYTLVYNYGPSRDVVETLIKAINVSHLEDGTVTFNKMALVEIDFWGRPKRILYEVPLKNR